ncbi:MAG: glycosyltransferase family 39 protein [Anaerolineae bacterium]
MNRDQSSFISFAVPRPVLYIGEGLLLCVILVLAAYLRLTNVAENPGWYTDETTHIDIANHRLEGSIQYMLIKDSTLLFGRLPLFHVLLAAAFQISDSTDHMLVLRSFTGLLGVVSVGMLYAAVRGSGGSLQALLAALMLAIYPQAVLYSRFGFSYGLLPPIMLLTILALERFLAGSKAGWLALAALALGIGLVAEVWTLALVLPFVIAAAFRPRHLIWSLPLVVLPVIVYSFIMLGSAPEAFGFDLRFTLSRLVPSQTLTEQWDTLFNNMQILTGSGLWMLAGIIGLFALQPVRLRWLGALFFFIPIVLIGRTNALYNLSAYYMIPLLPLVALGVAALIRYGIVTIWQTAHQYLPVGQYLRSGAALLVSVLLILFVAGAPLLAGLVSTIDEVQQGYVTDIDSFLINPRQAKHVAAFINSRVGVDDVIVTSPVVGWQFGGHPEDFQMAVAANDYVATPHLPGDIPLSRLAFDPDYQHARFVVMDNLWHNWGEVHIPGLRVVVADVQANWPEVFQEGQFVVYENPQLASQP